MGYSGLGMQSWIYKRKLHRPFSKRGKVPTFASLPSYSRTFALKPKSKENRRAVGFTTIAIILLFFSALYILGSKWHQYESSLERKRVIVHSECNETAFQFLLNSGKSRLSKHNVSGAYSEFVLAHKIDPKNENVVNLLIETTHTLCIEDQRYCDALEYYLDYNFKK
ncbi:hypothetical protein [Lacinutrix sp. Hel_I_90]|uniref:hypothetical protein n=1 Tax=Lacinutrix sp. Hel_I_90 TaxID=1249999 RepID=UPI0005CA42D5|nr:hypothetical protein [Lacinutrix sp. Hel_I_90]